MSLRPAFVSSTLVSSALALGSATMACGDDASLGTGGSGGGASSSASTGAQATSTTASGPTSGPTTTGGQGGDGSGGGSGGGGMTAGTGGDATGGAGTGGGAQAFPDECSVPEDCPGGECIALPGGFRTCRDPIDETRVCPERPLDECCSSEECGDGEICAVLPDATYCGGAAPEDYNACVLAEDDCAGLDCAESDGVCVPSGVYGYKEGQCVASFCASDDACDAEAGGRCVPIFDPCCGAVVGFFCAYPSDGCRFEQECGGGSCEGDPDTGRAACVDGPAECPP